MRRRKQKRYQLKHRTGNHKKAFRGILEKKDVFEKLKRQEEDILKYIYENDSKCITEERLEKVFRNINGDLDKIIIQLKDKKYIKNTDGTYSLTSNGSGIAELIFRIHNEIEDYINRKTLKCNAHQMAHLLEHKLTELEIESMIKASELKDKGKSLNNFNLPSGTIVDINLLNCRIWTKLISMGIFPGQRIQILNRAGHNYLLGVKGSRIAIDLELAEGIYLIP